MRTMQGSTLDTLRAIQQFVDDNGVKLGSVVNTGTRRQLDQALAELAGFAATQSGNKTVGDAAQAAALRTALIRDHMTLVARIAAVDLPVTPALSDLRMPKGKPTLAKLVAAAYGMAKSATPYRDVFIAAGMPGDFLAQLTAAADVLAAFDSQRKQLKAQNVAATTGLRSKLSAAARVVSVIDGMVKSALRDDEVLLAGWNSVKKARKIAPRPATPPAPVPIPGHDVAPAPTTPPAEGAS